MCGYTVAQFDKICSAQEMVDRLVGEYKEAKEKIKAGA